MPNDKAVSKFLSYVLRHKPEAAGVTLDPAGWVAIDALIASAERAGRELSREDLERITRENDKKRFTISPDGLRIRAAQGHSVEVDLGLMPVIPPDTLFHGTADRNVEAILAEGLKPQSRQHVHLSPDVQTARKVGARHGKPVILTIASHEAHDQGQIFWQAENGVWLTNALDPKFLTLAT